MAGGQHLEQQIRVGMAAVGIRGMAELARRSGVGRDTLYAWFRGDQEPKPDTLARIAEVLGVPLPSLWTYTPDAQGNPLVNALDRQTAVLETLAQRLTELTEAQSIELRQLSEAIGELLGLVASPARSRGGSELDADPVPSSRPE